MAGGATLPLTKYNFIWLDFHVHNERYFPQAKLESDKCSFCFKRALVVVLVQNQSSVIAYYIQWDFLEQVNWLFVCNVVNKFLNHTFAVQYEKLMKKYAIDILSNFGVC